MGLKHSYRVACDALIRTGYGAPPPCRFSGYRKASSPEEAAIKPCPRCGGRIQATPTPAGSTVRGTHRLTIPR